jgi:hypothetical protein
MLGSDGDAGLEAAAPNPTSQGTVPADPPAADPAGKVKGKVKAKGKGKGKGAEAAPPPRVLTAEEIAIAQAQQLAWRPPPARRNNLNPAAAVAAGDAPARRPAELNLSPSARLDKARVSVMPFVLAPAGVHVGDLPSQCVVVLGLMRVLTLDLCMHWVSAQPVVAAFAHLASDGIGGSAERAREGILHCLRRCLLEVSRRRTPGGLLLFRLTDAGHRAAAWVHKFGFTLDHEAIARVIALPVRHAREARFFHPAQKAGVTMKWLADSFVELSKQEVAEPIVVGDLIPDLCQGDVFGANSTSLILELQIGAIVNILDNRRPEWMEALEKNDFAHPVFQHTGEEVARLRRVQWIGFAVPDNAEAATCAALHTQLVTLFEFITANRQRGNRVYIHCRQGRSRSMCVTLSYMVAHHGLPLAKALRRVKDLGRSTHIMNFGFQGICSKVEEQRFPEAKARGALYNWVGQTRKKI